MARTKSTKTATKPKRAPQSGGVKKKNEWYTKRELLCFQEAFKTLKKKYEMHYWSFEFDKKTLNIKWTNSEGGIQPGKIIEIKNFYTNRNEFFNLDYKKKVEKIYEWLEDAKYRSI